MSRILLVAAVAMGLLFAYVDSRPSWDDTGVMAGAVLITCAVLGALGPKQAWMYALGVGIWIPAWNIVTTGNYGSLIALVFAFVGAYIGAGLRLLGSAVVAPR